nr:hypothetical protein [Tanacetum cinerariifolium]
FSKYKTAQELWAAILKTFSGNEATKKTKKNQLKQQYRNFKAEGKETLEQTFNRQQAIAIVSHLEFMDVEIEQDDLNQKFLTSLAPEWLMYMIVWRNRADLDTMSLDDLYNHLKVYEPEVQKKSELNSQNMAFISSSKNRSGKEEVNTASIPTASTQVSPASANVAVASITLDTVCAYIASQSNGSQIKYEDINQIDKDDIKDMDIKSSMSQDRGRRENFKQGSKTEESAPKALMAIDEVGWDWSYMANEEENHALVADEDATTELIEFGDSYQAPLEESGISSVNESSAKKKERTIAITTEDMQKKRNDVKARTTLLLALPDEHQFRFSKYENAQELWGAILKTFSGNEATKKTKKNQLKQQYGNFKAKDIEQDDLNQKFLTSLVPEWLMYTIGWRNRGDSSKIIKTNKVETARKPPVRYAEMYKNTSKSPNVRGNQRN